MRAAELEVPQFVGITAHDGSYLAEFVLSKGYAGHGVVWHTSSLKRSGLAHLWHSSTPPWDPVGKHFGHGDLTDGGSLQRFVRATERAEGYSLDARRHVGVFFNQPGYTKDAGRLSTTPLSEATRNVEAPSRFYPASTSELCGAHPPPRRERTRFRRGNRYAVATPSTRAALVLASSVGRVSCAWVKAHQGPYLVRGHTGDRVRFFTSMSFRQVGGFNQALNAAKDGTRALRARPRGYIMARITAMAPYKEGASDRWQCRRNWQPYAAGLRTSTRAHPAGTVGQVVRHPYLQGRWSFRCRPRLALALTLLSFSKSKCGRLGFRLKSAACEVSRW